MKKFLLIILVTVLLLCATACTSSKVLHCDGCGKEVTVTVDKDKQTDESWVVFCEECRGK